MGRRKSLISVASINRFINSLETNKRQREKTKIINQHSGSKKEMEPEYYITNVEFNNITRNTKIHFEKVVMYRTIERYITRDYIKYPVYSDWKRRNSVVVKNIKLTNEALESLIYHDDFLLCDFAAEIIYKLKDMDLVPSWMQLQVLKDNKSFKTAEIQSSITERNNKISNSITSIKQNSNQMHREVAILKTNMKKLGCIKKRIKTKASKIKEHKSNIFLNVITFGLIPLMNGKRRFDKLTRKENNITQAIENAERSVARILSEISKNNENINNYNKQLENNNESLCNTLAEIEEEYIIKSNSITTLHSTHVQNDEFKPLKYFSGLNYERIIGVYIIRNNELDKYYVGQSKDVLRRLKQHFKDLQPNNIIFAEDYYNSKLEDKSQLFSVKIISLSTKDELDSKEKELIELYSSKEYGYNKTSGNM